MFCVGSAAVSNISCRLRVKVFGIFWYFEAFHGYKDGFIVINTNMTYKGIIQYRETIYMGIFCLLKT